MGQSTCTVCELEREMEEIDEAIITHNKIIENLRFQRFEILARKNDWEMQEVFEYAIESGFTPDEVMDMLLATKIKKATTNIQ